MVHRAQVLGLFFLLFTYSVLGADIAGLGSNVTGRWSVTIFTANGRILGEAELTQTGNQVTGWLEPNEGDPIPLSGAVLSGKLIITTHPERRHLAAFDRCELTVGSNHMKGKFYPGAGKIEFWKLRQPHFNPRPGRFGSA